VHPLRLSVIVAAVHLYTTKAAIHTGVIVHCRIYSTQLVSVGIGFIIVLYTPTSATAQQSPRDRPVSLCIY
jgi:hypothetical protein